MRITRTIAGTRATVLLVNTQTLLAEKKVVTLSGTYENNEKLIKVLKKLYDNGTMVISTVLATEKFDELYGLDENIFMKYAVKLDAKTRKPIEPQAFAQVEPTVEPSVEPTAEPTAKSTAKSTAKDTKIKN